MNTPSASRAETPSGAGAAPTAVPSSRAATVLVWDLPVRLFHWTMALSFAGAWLTAESERWRLVHVSLGYSLAVLVVFRIVWGVIGSRHARFTSFVRGPSAVLAYLRSLTGPRPQHHVGHNPAGGWAILGLLGLGLVVVGAGWATYENVGGEWLEELHEAAAQLMLALVGLHVAAVVLSSLLHRENLVRAMVTGRKRGAPADGIRSSWRSVAVLLLIAVLGTWAASWSSGPSGTGAGSGTRSAQGHGHDDDDD